MVTVTEVRNKKDQLLACLLVGSLSGLGFGIGGWGIGAITLAGSNGMFPFAKFIPGTIFCILVGLLAGWLTCKITSVLGNVIIWAVVLTAYNRIFLYVTFPGMQYLLKYLNPKAASLVNYTIDYGVDVRMGLMLVISIVFGLIMGLLVNSFVEESSNPTYPFRRWSSLILWMAAFLGLAFLTDSLNQKPMREAVVIMNNVLDYPQIHPGETVPPTIELTLKSLMQYLDEPRRMIADGYDQMMILITVIIQFDQDHWASCTVINGQAGTCKILSDP
jgi:hypothetical protein